MQYRQVCGTTAATSIYVHVTCSGVVWVRWIVRIEMNLKDENAWYRKLSVGVENRRGPGCSPLQCLFLLFFLLLVQHLNSDLC